MSDLVDYLRDKLEQADDVVCSCPDIGISDWSDRAANRRHTIKGRDPGCLEHGGGWIRE